MNNRTTFILLFVFIFLSGFIWLYESKLPTAEEKEIRAHQLIDFDVPDVTRLDIYLGHTHTTAIRTDLGWQLKRPIEAKGDPQKIEALLATLSQARFIRSVELDSIGEVRAEFTLWIQKEPIHIQLGQNTPLGKNIYLKASNHINVLIVPASLFRQVIRNPDDLKLKEKKTEVKS